METLSRWPSKPAAGLIIDIADAEQEAGDEAYSPAKTKVRSWIKAVGKRVRVFAGASAPTSIPPLQANHHVDRQFGVEMREHLAAARFFPADRVAEPDEIDLDEHQIGLAGEMLGQRSFELLGGREVDIAVGDVDRGAAKDAFAFEIGPLLMGQYLEGGGRDLSLIHI